MGAGIAVTNAAAIADRVRSLRATLDTWLESLELQGGPDEAAIQAHLEATKRRLEEGT